IWSNRARCGSVAVKSATGVAQSTITTSGGIYSINLLPVGMYTVTVTKQGLHKEIRTNIAAIAGRTESRRPKAERLGRSVGEAHQTAGVAFRQRSRLSAVFGRPSGTVGKTAPSGHRKAFEVK